MKGFEELAKKEIIYFYSIYVRQAHPSLIKEKARMLHQKYLAASTILGSAMNRAIGKLVDFYAKTGIEPPSKEEARIIIETLSEEK
ncbi:hypothetical protein JW898_03680 [Candidatus Woesearchaeota archaeon]|nr:hypothetical protein [Candidatus Woesearchaeota archaeon]